MKRLTPAAIAAIWLCLSPATRAGVPTRLEPAYYEAVLAYQAKDCPRALRSLDELDRVNPRVVESLQLRALCLKTDKDPNRAIAIYEKLIELSEQSPTGAIVMDVAAYHYEIGVLRYQQGQLVEAKPHLEAAAKAGFNEGPSDFFLGNIAMKQGAYPEAERALHALLKTAAEELKPPAHFLLAQIALKSSNPSSATQSLLLARDAAKGQLESAQADSENHKLAAQIHAAASDALKPLDRSARFASVALTTGYDSNVLAIPSGDAGATGSGSPRGNLSFGAGYSSSPLGAMQYVPSYRGNLTLHASSDASAGNSFSHTLSLYATRRPLAVTSWGAKIDGCFLFQNVANADSEGSSMKPYSAGLMLGPYFKTQALKGYTLGAELFAGPQSFFQDKLLTANLKRGGVQGNLRLYGRRESSSRLLNPGVAVVIADNHTSGTEYRVWTKTLELSDVMRFGALTTFTVTGSLALASYGSRAPVTRADKTLTLGGGLVRKLGTKLSALADASLIKNTSDVPASYSYNRWTLSGGLTYAF